MTRTELAQYILETYSTEPDYPWLKSPTFAVFRQSSNRKWFALIMDIPRDQTALADRNNEAASANDEKLETFITTILEEQ